MPKIIFEDKHLNSALVITGDFEAAKGAILKALPPDMRHKRVEELQKWWDARTPPVAAPASVSGGTVQKQAQAVGIQP